MKKILIVIMAVFLCTAASAVRSMELDELLENIEKSDKEIKSLKIDYVQEITMAYTDQAQRMIGRAFFVKPDNIRVEHIKPVDEIFVTNGKKVWFYNPGLNQLLVGKWKDMVRGGRAGMGGLPRGLFDFSSSIGSLKDDYEMELLPEGEPDFYVIRLYPKAMAGYQIKLWISVEDYFPMKTSIITEAAEISTNIISIEKNPKLNKKLFKFKKPKGAEVMEFPF